MTALFPNSTMGVTRGAVFEEQIWGKIRDGKQDVGQAAASLLP
jgi:hypothetical protein